METHHQAEVDSSSPGMTQTTQKHGVIHVERDHQPAAELTDKPFWRTPLFLGTYLALSLSLMGYYAGFAMPSNTLSIIDADLGKPTSPPNAFH